MKYKILVIVFGLLLATAAVAEDVNETIDAAADGHVDVFNTSGSIEVVGWSRSSVEVTGELGDKVEELVLERDDDQITVKVKAPKRSSSNIFSEILVKVPQNSSIEVSSVSADITVEDVLGEQGLHTVSGDVETDAASADIDVASVSGDIDIDGDGKDIEARANTVSGDVTFTNLGGEVDAEVVSGDVTVDSGSFHRVAVETVNGDLIFEAELRDSGKFAAESVNGDIEIDFAGSFSAELDIDSFNGDIENCFGPEAERTSKYAPGLELRFTEGDGSGDVSISTLNGDIYICKEGD